MIVTLKYEQNINKLIFFFQLETNDHTSFYTPDRKLVTINRKKCYFTLPDNYQLDQLHPDRLALAIFLCCFPFIGQRLQLPFSVSHQFAQIIRANTRIQIPQTSQLAPQPLNYQTVLDDPETVPSLCLSMGMDSTAALLIMPKNTVGVFLDRAIGISQHDMYQKDCVYHGLTYVSQLQQTPIYSVTTDMEYLRKSIGFMIDISVGVPAILLSNHANFSSIGYGYSIHHYEHYFNSQLIGHCTGDDTRFNYHGWNQIFQAAGLNLNFITMGLTEIGTLKVVLNSPLKDIATGCMRGRINRPCLNCKKCYRKVLLKHYLTHSNLQFPPAVYSKLQRYPYHSIPKILDLDTLKFAFGYMTADYQGHNPFLQTIKKGLQKYRKKFKYLDKWFSGAETCMDPKIYQAILAKLPKYNMQVAKK